MIVVEVINNKSIDIIVKNKQTNVTVIGNTTTITEQPYMGEYHICPCNEQVILQTKNRSMLDNVIVDPVPKNYGLITYNGFSITVS